MGAVDLSRLTVIECIAGEDETETRELLDLYREAESFLNSFSWNTGIKSARFGLGISNIVAVFLFEIRPARPAVDEVLWVVVGDLPPAYLVTDDAPHAPCALRAYIWQMRRWVAAVKTGEPVAGLIPVNAPATLANAEALGTRLDFLEQNILDEYREGLP